MSEFLLETDDYSVELSGGLVFVNSKSGSYPVRHASIGPERHAELLLDYVPKIEFTRESWWRKLGKVMRIDREVQSGDATFDRAVYIRSSAPTEYIAAVLSEASTRDAIRELLEGDFRSLEVASPEWLAMGMTAGRKGRQPLDSDHPDVQRFARIVEALPTTEVPNSGREARTRDRTIVYLVAAVAAPLLAFGMATDDSWRVLGPLGQGLKYGAFAWAASLPVLLLSMRGYSDSLKNIALATLIAGCGLVAGVGGVLRAANAVFDTSEARIVEARISDMEQGTGKARYNRLWLEPDGDLPGGHVNVDDSLYERLKVGDRVEIDVKRGSLGWPWIQDLTAD